MKKVKLQFSRFEEANLLSLEEKTNIIGGNGDLHNCVEYIIINNQIKCTAWGGGGGCSEYEACNPEP